MTDKIFYGFVIKIFRKQLHNYFMVRIPPVRYGPGCKLPLNKRVYAEDCRSIDANGVLRGKTTTKHYIRGWNDCVAEIKLKTL